MAYRDLSTYLELDKEGSDKDMKLLIVHLSDMHFGDDKNYLKENVNGIINALNVSVVDIQHVLIIVSGDLTFSGKQEQYKKVNNFFYELKRGIFDRYIIQDIRFVMVPGNHDMDYACGVGDRKRVGLEEIEKTGTYEENIKDELEKLEQFYMFAGHYYCFGNKNLLHKKTLTYGETKIQINLINTAIFSSNDEDQGYHFISELSIPGSFPSLVRR